MASYFILGSLHTGEKYCPPRLPVTPISGPLPDPARPNWESSPIQCPSESRGLRSAFSLWGESPRNGIRRWEDTLAHDPAALKRFEKENKLPRPHADLVHQKLGFVVVRTDYSEESDGLIEGVMGKIHAWMMADLDAILEPGVVLSAEQRQAMSRSFMNLLLDDKAVYDGLELRDVSRELDWAVERGPEESYVEEEGPWETVNEYSWRDEIQSCCNPDCLHPSHVEPRQKLYTVPVRDEAAQAADEKIWEAKEEAESRKSYGKPFYLRPEILKQAKHETCLRRKWGLMKEAEWKLSPQACLVLDIEAMRSIAKCDVDPDKYADWDSGYGRKGPFINIVLERKNDMEYDERWYIDSCDPPVYSTQRMGRLDVVNNPLAMVFTLMAEESQHEFDVEQTPGAGYTSILIRSQEPGWGSGEAHDGYPELQSVIKKERANGCPQRVQKDGDPEKAKRLSAELDEKFAKWARERVPEDQEKRKERLKREEAEGRDYRKMWGIELPEEQEANYGDAWASTYPK